MRRTIVLTVLTVLTVLGTSVLVGCADDPSPGDGTDTLGTEDSETAADEIGESGGECVVGEVQPCACEEGGVGEQTCTEDGWGACISCALPPECGNGVCESGEVCDVCVEDCGLCIDCEEAPSCEQAAIPGVIDTRLEALDVLPEQGDPNAPGTLALDLASRVEHAELGVRVVVAALDDQVIVGEHPEVAALRDVFARFPDRATVVRRQLATAGVDDLAAYRAIHPAPRGAQTRAAEELAPPSQAAPEDCEDPKLRIRMAKIIVHEEADLVFKDIVYCVVAAEAQPGAEIRVTPKTFALDSGDEYALALGEGIVWGQAGEPVAPEGNLALTYNCLEGDDTSAFEDFLAAIAEAADGVGGVPLDYGWIVPVIGAAAEIIGAALALEQDDHLFNASQIIPAELQLEMTPGVWWSVQREGVFNLKPWRWELRMEAWGCTDDGGAEPGPRSP